jgi:hypothetical protein
MISRVLCQVLRYKKVWRNQRGNQKQQIKGGLEIKWPQENVQKDKQEPIRHDTEKTKFFLAYAVLIRRLISTRGRRHHGRDRMVVGLTTTYAISAYHH